MKRQSKKLMPLSKARLVRQRNETTLAAPHKKVTSKKSTSKDVRKRKQDLGNVKATETVSLQKIKTRNLHLLKQLEQKKQELKVETSLEKVRAMALGMRKPEDLPKVCEILYRELQASNSIQLYIQHLELRSCNYKSVIGVTQF